ncbi:MAG: hypothetical protein K5905_09340 [Roseibium sp.]|uniref:hypothetical protein n=1 Tax=Roseibium sp. TaxID=1936156 RepID=UPI0026275D7E|nr:hypothetical protein [Roseibium sp.]MCV0425666.1 hypothetical protein [Roseibium sp.]
MAFDFFSGFVRDVRAARSTAKEVERLSRMNNSDLARLGLERTEISSYAYNKHFGRR